MASTAPKRIGRQVAALPLLRQRGQLGIVLVTSRESGRWVLPKGWSEPGLNGAEAASKEAFEEAGLIGKIEPRPCGVYRYSKRMSGTHRLVCEVSVFAFRVTEMLDEWPEMAERRRRVVSPAEAAGLVNEVELARLLRGLV